MAAQQKKILIFDYGLGNPKSVLNMLKYLDYKSEISGDIKAIHNADIVIIPGVGHFGEAMARIKEKEADKALIEHANAGKHLIGICLGMQLLCTHSEEGDSTGLGLIPGIVKRFPDLGNDLKVPNMGWRNVDMHHSIFSENYPDSPRFYFTHSYYVECESKENVLMDTDYGIKYNSAIIKNNIIGFQFHPEKSHAFGAQLFRNLLKFVHAT